jgi:Flp pilus assembly protein TadG
LSKQRKIEIRSERGQTMVEFALVLPIFCLLLFGIIQFGIIWNNYVTLTDAVRAGARKAVVSSRDPDASAMAIAAVRSSAGNLNGAANCPRLCPTVTSSWDSGSDVTVRATYQPDLVLGDVVRFFGVDLEKYVLLKAETTERVE